ncbi:hypothetical protein [Streptomyces sp. NPDC001665]
MTGAVGRLLLEVALPGSKNRHPVTRCDVRIPARAKMTGARKDAAVVAPAGQPVAAVICGLRTGDA